MCSHADGTHQDVAWWHQHGTAHPGLEPFTRFFRQVTLDCLELNATEALVLGDGLIKSLWRPDSSVYEDVVYLHTDESVIVCWFPTCQSSA
jgi:hypothetical protein